MSVHAADCNHSCTPSANHGCEPPCDHSCMGVQFGELFKTIRTAAGDTPAEAARKVGISRQGYMKWESGDTANVKIGHLTIFCDKYNVEINALIRGRIEYIGKPSPENPVLEETLGIYQVKPPDPDEALLVEAYRKADVTVKRMMLAQAREVLSLFEKRSEQSN